MSDDKYRKMLDDNYDFSSFEAKEEAKQVGNQAEELTWLDPILNKEASTITTSDESSSDLFVKLISVSKDLYFPSESEYNYYPFQLEYPASSTLPTESQFISILKEQLVDFPLKDPKVKVSSLDQFMKRLTSDEVLGDASDKLFEASLALQNKFDTEAKIYSLRQPEAVYIYHFLTFQDDKNNMLRGLVTVEVQT